MQKKKARVIALYLPQFHPIPENDKYWGKGFTEWTNVAKAKPLFKGHNQPNVPSDLGFYDLRMPEVREEQAKLAKQAGIEGFCYWHYWFGGGKELLERPFNEVVESGSPDFPFCLGWANHSWSTRTWTASNSGFQQTMIAEMTYPGEEDHINHFYKYLKAFKDARYIKVDGKLLFLVFDPHGFKDFGNFKRVWNELAQKEGLTGFHFVGVAGNFNVKDDNGKANNIFSKEDNQSGYIYKNVLDMGFDAVNSRGINRGQALADSALSFYWKRFWQKIFGIGLMKMPYSKVIKNFFVENDKWENVYPTIIPNFDRSPRSGKKTNFLWYGSTPELFRKHIGDALKLIENKQPEHRILFLMSWNEWGEGNYMEPDIRWGHGYLDALKDMIVENL